MPPKLGNIGPTVRSMDMRTARPAPKTAETFYVSKAWRDLVAALIARCGRRCQACGKTREDDSSPVRVIGDHIVERKDGGADLDERNIELLCARSGGNGRPRPDGRTGGCHPAKTAAKRIERMNR
jgi:5-methylcytosine-specific restriction enzyme A